MKKIFVAVSLLLSMTLIGCSKTNEVSTTSNLTAQEVLNKFFEPNANYKELTASLKPTDKDYATYFEAGMADKAKEAYSALWNDPSTIIAPQEGQTELIIYKATTEEIKNQTGQGVEFPGGYKDVIDQIKPGQTIYRFKFVKPGETLGMSFDGFVNVNGHWTLFPKPFNLLK